MTSASVTKTELVRWCGKCGGPATALGSHNADGSFDPYSVPVSEIEIEMARRNYPGHSLSRSRDVTRECIALGKHIGTYGS